MHEKQSRRPVQQGATALISVRSAATLPGGNCAIRCNVVRLSTPFPNHLHHVLHEIIERKAQGAVSPSEHQAASLQAQNPIGIFCYLQCCQL